MSTHFMKAENLDSVNKKIKIAGGYFSCFKQNISIFPAHIMTERST